MSECVSVNGCGLAMNWRFGWGVTLPSPCDSWEMLQQTPVVQNSGTNWCEKINK